MSVHLEVRDGKLVRSQLPLLAMAEAPRAAPKRRCEEPAPRGVNCLVLSTLCLVVLAFAFFVAAGAVLYRVQANLLWAEQQLGGAHAVEMAAQLLSDASRAMRSARATSEATEGVVVGGAGGAAAALNATGEVLGKLTRMLEHPTVKVSLE